MERMFAGIVIVEDNFNHLIVPKNKRIRMEPIDNTVAGELIGGQCCVQRRNLRSDISDAVEEGIVCSIAEVAHIHGQQNGLVRIIKELLAIYGDKLKIVKWIKRFVVAGYWQRFFRVVDEVGRDIGVECLWDFI